MGVMGVSAVTTYQRIISAEKKTTRHDPVWIAGLGLGCILVFTSLGVHPIILVTLAGLTGLAVWRSLSKLVVVYVATIAVGLVIAARLRESTITVTAGPVDTYAALWIAAALFAGTLTHAWPSKRQLSTGEEEHSGKTVLALSAGALVVHVFLIVDGTTGLAAQYTGASSGGGYLGLFAQSGAVLAGTAVLSAHAAGRSLSPTGVTAGCLMVLHAVALAYTGFRGAGPIFIIAVMLAGLRGLETIRHRKQIVPAIILGGGVIALFIFGATIRTNIASQLGESGLAPPPVNTDNVFETVIERLDYRDALMRASELQDDHGAQEAVSLHDQIAAAVPRLINPDKASVLYGRRVAHSYFGLPANARTSSTITQFGDSLVNFGIIGSVAISGLYVFGIDRIFRLLGRISTASFLALRIIVAQYALDIGTPVALSVISMARTEFFIIAILIIARTVGKILPKIHSDSGKADGTIMSNQPFGQQQKNLATPGRDS